MGLTSCHHFGRILDRNRMLQIVHRNGRTGNMKSFLIGHILDSLGQARLINVIVGAHDDAVNVFALGSVGVGIRIPKLVLS